MAYDQIITKGGTSKTIEVMLRDSTTGQGKTGLAYTDMTIRYMREGAAANVSVTSATMTLGTWASGGFIVVDGTNQPGLYQFGIPDNALLTGADAVTLTFKASGIIDKSVRVVLIDANLRDGVRLGLTSLPNAVAGDGSGLPIGKTAYKLASDGLDSISTTAPTGVASNFREMLVQTWRRWFGKSILDADAGTLKTYAADGTTVVTTQTIAEDSTTQTIGNAS